jgi:2',3'-cyclic-nucleotide 2'-phosphodiesterase (5'-nucleotidase family)
VGGTLLAPSTQALQLIEALEQAAGSLCDQVGCLAMPLGRTREAESAVGNVVTDAMLAAVDVDLALTNSGGLRANMPAGPTRREHIQAVMPFDNKLVVVELSGTSLREVLRVGSSGAHGILQLSGGRYHFDPALTQGADHDGDGEVSTWEQDRLCSIEIGGKPLDLQRTYRIVTNDFLVDGGDHFGPAFEGTQIGEAGALLREAMADFFLKSEACIGADGPILNSEAARIEVGPCE